MTEREALRLVLKLLEEIHVGNMTPMAESNWNKSITAIKEALEQPSHEQEIETLKHCLFQMQMAARDLAQRHRTWIGLIKDLAQQQRTWVGLTDEERRSIREWQRIQEELGPVWAPMMLYLYEAIEAALKEKNT